MFTERGSKEVEMKHAKLYFELLQAFRGERLTALGFLCTGDLINSRK